MKSLARIPAWQLHQAPAYLGERKIKAQKRRLMMLPNSKLKQTVMNVINPPTGKGTPVRAGARPGRRGRCRSTSAWTGRSRGNAGLHGGGQEAAREIGEAG